MQDIINSFKAYLYDRSSNPVIGSFLFYWLLCNYKMVLVLFSDISLEKKFIEINNLYPSDNIAIFNIPNYYFEHAFFYPFLLTAFYILIFPFISKWFIGASVYHYNEIKKVQERKVITEEQRRRLEDDYLQIQAKYYSLSEENKKLNKIISENENTSNTDEENSTTLNEIEHYYESGQAKIDEEQNKIFKEEETQRELTDIMNNALIMISNQDKYNLNNLAKNYNIHRIRAEEIKDNMLNQKLIEEHPHYPKTGYVRITNIGKQYLLANKLI